jgi:hypothetical protein
MKKQILWDMIAAARAGKQIDNLRAQSLAERKLAGASYESAMKKRPEHVAGCLALLFAGSYGSDAMHLARRHVLARKANANKVAP